MLLSRQGFEVPDEVRVLQAENCHFRDLTFARLAEVEYWKKMYTQERNANNDRLEALRKEYELRIEEELRKYRKGLDDPSRFNRERDEIHARYQVAILEQIARLKAQHSQELSLYLSPAQADALYKEIEALKKDRDALIIEHELKVKNLKADVEEAIKVELLKMAQKHTQEMYNLHSSYEQLRKLFKKEMSTNEIADREKLENIIKIIKNRDEEHEANQQELLNRLNMSKSQQMAYLNSESNRQAQALRDETLSLRLALEGMEKERDEMYRFSKRLIDEAIVDQEIARRIKFEFQNEFSDASSTKNKFKNSLGDPNSGVSNFISTLDKTKMKLNLDNIPSTSNAELVSPTFNPTVPVFKSSDDVANNYFTLGNNGVVRFPASDPQTSTDLKKRVSLLKDLESFVETQPAK